MKRIKKAVIPAAGLGTRFYPITKCIPKEMFPVGNKPVIHHVIHEALESGIEEIAIITSKKKGVIEDYIDEIPEFDNICFFRQNKQLGLGNAIQHTKSFVNDEPFAVLLGDDITVGDIPLTRQLMDASYTNNNNSVAISMVDDVTRYGIVSCDPYYDRIYKLNSIIEKPNINEAPSKFGIIGRYVLDLEIFEIMSQNTSKVGGEQLFTYSLDIMAKSGKLIGVNPRGVRYDLGYPEGYIKYIQSLKS